MSLLFDSFWRAAAYCLHPRVIAWSLLPLLLMSVLTLALGWFFWESALDAVQARIDAWVVVDTLLGWLSSIGLGGFRSVLAPMVVVFLATPVIVVASLVAVATLMTPSMLALVTDRRFPNLEKRHGGSALGGVLVGALATAAALLALAVTMPLWLIPPLVLVLPPLIWGWLSYRVLSYEVLADHASAAERHALLREHRPSLLAMGVVSGYLGAAPSLVWASGVLFVALAPVLVPMAIWIYTLVFAFSSLWFAHFTLAALQQARAASEPSEGPPVLRPLPDTPSSAPDPLPIAAPGTRRPDALSPP